MGAAGAPGRLAGRVGIVTGAGRGVGRAIALALAAEGMQLALVARGSAQVQAVAEEITAAYDVPVFPAALDVRDGAAVDRLVAHVEQRLGPVDLLVDSSARPGAADGPLRRAVLPVMLARRQGCIVNLGAGRADALAGTLVGTGVTVSDLVPGEAGPAAVVRLALGEPANP